MAIRIGILGYGNLAKGVELAIRQNKDMELAAVFTRRDPSTVKTLTPGVKVVPSFEAADYQDKIDVLVICGGSATDLPTQTPEYASMFNVIDSFDTHAKIPEHFAKVDKAASSSKHTALISGGWDPGMFSISRLYGSCSMQTASFPKVRITHSGARAFHRATPMLSEEFRALRTANSTPSLLRALSKQ